MEIKKLHSWYLTQDEAEDLQNKLQKYVILNSKYSSVDEIKTVCGIDVHFFNEDSVAIAGLAIFSFPEVKLLSTYTQKKEIDYYFPYKSGLLAFRELPVVIQLLENIKLIPEPDIFIYDGHGIAHPKGIGVASHLGIFIDKPTIGCSKQNLYGTYEEPPPGLKGTYTFIKDLSENIIGTVVRTKPYTKPLFISIGHRISLEIAIDIVVTTCKNYRLPEPLRIAHQAARQYKK